MVSYILAGRKSVSSYIIIILGLFLIVSCHKPDESPKYDFHIYRLNDGEEYELYGYATSSRKRKSGRDPVYDLGNVFFGPLTDNMGRQNELITVFEYGDEIRWYINSPNIVEEEKYYYDSSDSFLRPYKKYDNVHVGPVNKISSGWMSFTTEVEDPDIILRVSYEVDYHRDNTIKHASGGVDFYTGMAGRIHGGERLITKK